MYKNLNKVIDKNEDFVYIVKLLNDNVFDKEILGVQSNKIGENLMI